ncbi:discoidin domain-containing protein [Frateuria defendens]|uniref:discoidin domain-containing protein n=1 Tax=Frateuria defendens TaxID=2219559 RepID=UPI001F16A594|nr:discoidin domain-containing protein [Frateuria defendens]
MALLLLAQGMPAKAVAANEVLDDFSRPDVWTATATDDIEVRLRPIEEGGRRGICLDFDFHGVSGGATLRRALPVAWPANFALGFELRGAMPANDLQLKLIEASGDNVWWYRREAFRPAADWQAMSARRRDIDFAWGPGQDRTLRRTATLELTAYAGQGGRGTLCLANLRLVPLPPEPPGAAAAPPDTPNARFQRAAAQAPRGLYPRGFSGEQSYWTLVGVDGGGRHAALLSEDGAVEVDRGGWSVEPMLFDGGRAINWATVKTRQSLLDGYLPIPSVHWQAGGLRLDTTAFADGPAARPRLLLRYTLHNDGDTPRRLSLALLLRPFQVNPPTQFLNTPGGISPIHDFAWDGRVLTVNGGTTVLPLQTADAFVAGAARGGNLPERLRHGERPHVARLHDADGAARGALLYTLDVPAHGQRTVGLVLPPPGEAFAPPSDADAWLQRRLDDVAAGWREKLNRVRLALPPAQQALADTARSALAQILLSRDGPALQPGTRSYARSWVRDGAMMAEGLVRSGHADAAADFVRWYAPHQFRSGKVPCCVDARGADPVPEHDSHGELVFAVAELWRYTRDRALIEPLWPHVARAVAYMDGLRAEAATAAEPLRGLLPASISHEGYSAKPMHAYWDDFWGLVGYGDAAMLARALGKNDEAARIATARDAFRADLARSLAASMRRHRIDYLPGAAELGDFDATSTTIALSPGDGLAWLPRAAVERTFARYWQGFVARRDGTVAWDDYTPYELRTVASFVRLGWRGRVGALLDFFFADRRPAAWNQWAEVVGRDPRRPRFVGDMPHAWIASDYLRSAYDLFAYERAGDRALVLGAGLQPGWLAGAGVGIAGLRTPYGALSYTLRERAGRLELDLAGGLAPPPGGLVLPWPYPGAPGVAYIDGRSAPWHGRELRIDHVPARVVMEGAGR